MTPALILLAVWLFAVLARLGHLKEVHHGYYGIAFGIAYVVSQWTVLGVVALALLADDVVQHTVQLWKPASSVSVLRWVYGKTLYRMPAVQRLNAWLDGLFQ